MIKSTKKAPVAATTDVNKFEVYKYSVSELQAYAQSIGNKILQLPLSEAQQIKKLVKEYDKIQDEIAKKVRMQHE